MIVPYLTRIRPERGEIYLLKLPQEDDRPLPHTDQTRAGRDLLTEVATRRRSSLTSHGSDQSGERFTYWSCHKKMIVPYLTRIRPERGEIYLLKLPQEDDRPLPHTDQTRAGRDLLTEVATRRRSSLTSHGSDQSGERFTYWSCHKKMIVPYLTRIRPERGEIYLLKLPQEDDRPLPHTDQARAGRDFIPEGVANLSCSKRQLALVEFQQTFEIHKYTLRSFWTEKTEKIGTSNEDK